MTSRLTRFGLQQFGRSVGVAMQVGQRRFDVEVRIQAYSAEGPRMELEGESSVFLSAFRSGRESGLQPRLGSGGEVAGNGGVSSMGPMGSGNPVNQPFNQPMNPVNQSVYPPMNPMMNQPVMNQPVMNQPVMNQPMMNPPMMNPPTMNTPMTNQPSIQPQPHRPSHTLTPTPLVQTANTLRNATHQPLNVSIRDNQITVPPGAAGSQLFKVVIHNYSDRKVMVSLDPVLPPFACSYRDIVINPFGLLSELTGRRRKVRIPVSFSATTDGQSHSCVIGATVKIVD